MDIFDQQGVTNALYAVDYAWNIRHDPDLAVALWPGPRVDWLFFHVYQFTKIANKDGKGDCVKGFKKIYKDFMDRIDVVPEWGTIPWGLGEWGTFLTNKWIKESDRLECINGVRAMLEDKVNYPKLQASIYFNSLHCRLDETTASDAVQEAFVDFLGSDYLV